MPKRNYWTTEDGDDEDSDLDIEKDLHPLSHHVNHRKRLLEEALRTLKGKRLIAMIPPLIKDFDYSELEEACLDLLEDMDEDTILEILEGSSGKKKRTKKRKKAKESESSSVAEESKVKRKKVKKEVKEKTKGKSKKQKAAVVGQSAPPPNDQKSLMELVELEFRAKAIKALLRTQMTIDGRDSKKATSSKSVPDEPHSTPLLNLSNVSSKEKQKGGADVENSKNETQTISKSMLDELPATPLLTTSDRLKKSSSKKKQKNKKGTGTAAKSVPDESLPTPLLSTLDRPNKSSPKEKLNEIIDGAGGDNSGKRTPSKRISDELHAAPAKPLIIMMDRLSKSSSKEKQKDMTEEGSENIQKGSASKLLPDEPLATPLLSTSNFSTSDDFNKSIFIKRQRNKKSTVKRSWRNERDNSDSNPTSVETRHDSDSDDELVRIPSPLSPGEYRSDLETEPVSDESCSHEQNEPQTEPIAVVGPDMGCAERLTSSKDDPPLDDPDDNNDEEDKYVKTNRNCKSMEEIALENSDDELVGLFRPRSPVEYITSFDTEPISDESSSHEQSEPLPEQIPVTAAGQVLGCTERPTSSKDDPSPDHPDDAEDEEDKYEKTKRFRNRRGIEEVDPLEEKPKTWYERWFNSEPTQKIMKTNKIQKKLKKQMKATKPKPVVLAPNLDANAVPSEPIIGSIEEYEKIFGKKLPASKKRNPEDSSMANGDCVDTKDNSDAEDGDDDDLWGDIMGNA